MKNIQPRRFIQSVLLLEFCCCIYVISCDVLKRTVKYEKINRPCSDKDCGKKSGVVTSASGTLPCARRCANGGSCLGFSVDEDENCFLYEDCSAQADCFNTTWQPSANFHVRAGQVQEACNNGGVWNNEKRSCRCVNGWAGTYCDRPIQSCVDLPRYQLRFKGGNQLINITLPTTGRVLHVYCVVMNTFASTVVLRNTGRKSFGHLLWDDYLGGRKIALYNYWIGLDLLHELTEAGYNSLSFEVMYKDFPRHLKVYEDFHVGNSSTGYALTISGSHPVTGGAFTNQYGDMLGDCLELVNRTKFSAPDHDRDLDILDNCAAKAKRGWWFKDCNFNCNPLGLLYGAGDDALLLPGLDFKHSNYTDLFRRLDVYFWEPV